MLVVGKSRAMSLAAGTAKNMGIDAVLEEMRRHARSAQLHHYLHAFPHYGEMPVVRSCKALADLARGNAENQGKIGAQGGIELVLEAMRRHAGSAGVQESGYEALASLADGNAENQGKIGAQGGIKVITDGMEKHKDDSSVQRNGQAALRVITNVARQAVASSSASAVSAGAAGKRPRLEAPALSAGAGAAAGTTSKNNKRTIISLGGHRSGNAETDRKVRIMCVGAG
jgi:hypothetical protein